MVHQSEEMYDHNEVDFTEIKFNGVMNLEDKALFKHVLELDQLEKLINKVGPKDPQKFGKLEPFHGRKRTSFFMILLIIIAIGIIIFIYRGCDKQRSLSVGNDISQVGYETRAIFVR